MKTAREHLEALIRIPSPSAVSNRPLIEYAKHELAALGWSTRELAYRDAQGVEKVNLIAAPPTQDVHRAEVDLAFVCHTDTVPYASHWAEATAPAEHNGNLHGCGACDVKGYLACLLAAAATLQSFTQQLRIVLTAEEEIGCIGAAHLMASGAIKPRRAVIGEPTSLHPARAGKGYCLGEVVVLGAEAHSAHPQQGASAIYGAATLIKQMEALSQQLTTTRNEFFDPPFTTINVGTITGGSAKNIIPGRCVFLVEWRPIPGTAADDVAHALEAIVAHFNNAEEKLRATFTVQRRQPGFETPAASPLVQRVEALSGKQAVAIPFGTEASHLAAVAEEIVVFGAGDMRSAHSEREFVPLRALEQATTILAALMQENT
ncbi:acetylornithine deacetylase [Telmatobacter bradus]|uniref:acetylornithine deacetylase n=1 Tax=Telmatobacter bradus TaxID=474953 RepID=UPI003B433319